MSKGVYLKNADIYLRFPEIMEEECNDLAEFLEDEHIVYEGATDVFIEKDEEIEKLNNIINELEKYLFSQLLEYGGGGIVQEYYDKLKELKEGE